MSRPEVTQSRNGIPRRLIAAGALLSIILTGACSTSNPASRDPKNPGATVSASTAPPQRATRPPRPAPTVTLTAESTPTTTSSAITLIPDLSYHHDPNDETVCLNGGDRPCAILARTAPQLDAPGVNDNPHHVRATPPDQHKILWPREAYSDYPGDPVTITCYERGQTIKSSLPGPDGDPLVSDIWYRMLVPMNHVLNPDVRQAIKEEDPSVKVVTYGGQKVVAAMASAVWFGDETARSTLEAC